MGKSCCKVPTSLQILNGGILAPSNDSSHTYGPDLVFNGTFSPDSDGWGTQLLDGWNFDGSGATHVPNDADLNGVLSQQIVSELEGASYRITLTVDGMTAGTLDVAFGDAGFTSSITASGTYTEVITTITDTDILNLVASPDFDGTITLIKVELQLT